MTRPLSRYDDKNGIPYWMTNAVQARVILDGLYTLFHHVRMEVRQDRYDGPIVGDKTVRLPEDLTDTGTA